MDLGLVYKCEVLSADGGEKVRVEFTLTAPGCGMGDFPAPGRPACGSCSRSPG
ncbi:MAG: hypothetical protein U0599_15180 [Vicinamibacteria bacterium]